MGTCGDNVDVYRSDNRLVSIMGLTLNYMEN